jgi:hypothetical protein
MLVSLVAAAYSSFLSISESDLLKAGLADPTAGRFGPGLFHGVTNVGFRERASGRKELLTER